MRAPDLFRSRGGTSSPLLNTAQQTCVCCRSWALECGCVVVFTIEFVGRVLSCPDLRKFVGDFLNWIDLMAIVPFYIEEAVQSVRTAVLCSLCGRARVRVCCSSPVVFTGCDCVWPGRRSWWPRNITPRPLGPGVQAV